MKKSEVFHCKGNPEGKLDFTDHNRDRFKAFLRKNPGILLTISPLRVESSKQRRFFEGAVVPLCTYYQENMDWRNPEDLYMMREMLKIEHNGDMAILNGKQIRVAKSTSGVLDEFIERVIAWMEEQGYQTELLDPKMYKHWEDTIRPFGEEDEYIDYLLKTGKLKSYYNKTI